jgi:hypothetical protein
MTVLSAMTSVGARGVVMTSPADPRFRPGDRVVYVTREDAYLGTVKEVLFHIDTYLYSCAWDDSFEDGPRMYAEHNFRRVH